MAKPKPKYDVGERVEVHSWTKVTIATVKVIDWIYDDRMDEHCWGYKVDRDNCGLSFILIPEGYLRKLEE